MIQGSQKDKLRKILKWHENYQKNLLKKKVIL